MQEVTRRIPLQPQVFGRSPFEGGQRLIQISDGKCGSIRPGSTRPDCGPDNIKAWLKSLDGDNGARYEIKTAMGALYTFAQSEGLLPLGEQYDPVQYVKGIESTSDYDAAVLTPEQTLKVLEQLQQPEYTMLVLVAATGMRMSEMLGLKWSDISEDRGEIRIRRTYVYGELETGAKTKVVKVLDSHAPCAWATIKRMACRGRLCLVRGFCFRVSKASGTQTTSRVYGRGGLSQVRCCQGWSDRGQGRENLP